MYDETIRKGWESKRAAISSDDTLLTAAVGTMKNANIPDYAFNVPAIYNAIEVAWEMDADASNAVVYLFAAKEDGDIVLVWTGTLTAGKQVATGGGTWVDTVAGSTDNWITTVEEIDGGGADRMFRIALDTCGYKKFFCQYTGLSSETIKDWFTGF